ncbi:MAG TPA: GDSL-type esterase/lipase family protein [Candidatus Limnocylindrales bacterium]|nr:GDSL-type esterase/lipase family protein [Candidatus Limnocylindrales bacterium]HEX5040297.1 GDSL-type esterase/lipase family protein [Candidatus Limnocylindria bacterium]
MGRWMARVATIIGTALGAFAGIVAVQLLRLRRMEFLPGHPGFYINHIVAPSRPADDGRRLRLVVLGDSTTAGVGVERPEESLPYLLARHLADAEARRVHVVSYGWAGARIVDLPRSQLPRALEPLRSRDVEPFLPGADAIAIVIGANDATHKTPPGRFRADLRTTLETVRGAAPRARVVLAGIPGFRGALRGIEPLIFLADQYARLLRPISRDEARRAGAAYADLAAEVPDRIRGRSDVLSKDQFHPSAAGYAAWADVIAAALLAGPTTDAGGGELEIAGA